MPIINIPTGIGGKWLDKKNIVTGDVIKIVTEAEQIPNMNSEKGGMQTVAKVLVKGKSKEAENFALNVPTLKALNSVYGNNSADWKEKTFTAHVEKTLIGGKRGISVYLIPEGMVMKESDDGYLYIGHVDSPTGTIKSTLTPEQAEQIKNLREGAIKAEENIEPEPEYNLNDIPF